MENVNFHELKKGDLITPVGFIEGLNNGDKCEYRGIINSLIYVKIVGSYHESYIGNIVAVDTTHLDDFERWLCPYECGIMEEGEELTQVGVFRLKKRKIKIDKK